MKIIAFLYCFIQLLLYICSVESDQLNNNNHLIFITMNTFISRLTRKNVLSMTQKQRLLIMEQLQDKICNLDYIESPELSDVLNYNLSLIESKAVFNEY